jgi:predicted small integral membrane protein
MTAIVALVRGEAWWAIVLSFTVALAVATAPERP